MKKVLLITAIAFTLTACGGYPISLNCAQNISGDCKVDPLVERVEKDNMAEEVSDNMNEKVSKDTITHKILKY